MSSLIYHPIIMSIVAFVAMWLAAIAGLWLRRRHAWPEGEKREDFDLIVTATLTLLGLIIGFSFSMAIERYDQRKNLEEEEANAIGTEYLRADFLAPPDAANTRKVLVAYLNERIVFYKADKASQAAPINQRTNELQTALWTAVRGPAAANPTALTGLVASGMNDVINSAGYTQAAMLNRIPVAAWVLMTAIALCCNALLGYGARTSKWGPRLALVMPLIVAISFLLIADIDTPRRGLIRVSPINLISLAQSFGP